MPKSLVVASPPCLRSPMPGAVDASAEIVEHVARRGQVAATVLLVIRARKVPELLARKRMPLLVVCETLLLVTVTLRTAVSAVVPSAST